MLLQFQQKQTLTVINKNLQLLIIIHETKESLRNISSTRTIKVLAMRVMAYEKKNLLISTYSTLEKKIHIIARSSCHKLMSLQRLTEGNFNFSGNYHFPKYYRHKPDRSWLLLIAQIASVTYLLFTEEQKIDSLTASLPHHARA